MIFGKYKLKLQFLDSVKCRVCVLQWKYNIGNSWGVDLIINRGCIGCGNQEQFYGCVDIVIGYLDIELGYFLIINQMSKGEFIFKFGVFILFFVLIELEIWDRFVILDSGEEVDLVIVLS